jgi:hypothetical protein
LPRATLAEWVSRPLAKADPTVVADVSADAALQADRWRHPLWMVRVRADMDPGDVEQPP